MKSLLLFIFIISLTKCFCFKYNLPGDKNWPKDSDFQELKNKITGKVILKGDKDYNPFTWNRITYIPKPIVIVKPTNAQDIIEALKFARTFNIRISIQSTGHHQDHRNIYDNSILIDMSTMNQKSINLGARTLTLGPGNNFSQIQTYIATQSNKKLVALCGADPGVGIYGWTTGGGHGLLTRQYGLGVDSIISMDLILANYSIITASETQNQELFRALRGSGGGTYGIAISLTIKLFDSPGAVSKFGGLYLLTNKTAKMFADWMKNAPNHAGAYFLPSNMDAKLTLISAICFGNESSCSILKDLKDGCIPYPDLSISCNPEYEAHQTFYDFFKGEVSNKNGVTYLASTALNSNNIEEGLQEIVSYLDKNQYTTCSGNAVLGGASSLLDPNQEKTSVSVEMRKGLMAITCAAALEDKNNKDERNYQVGVMDYLAEKIMKKYSKWVYWNEPQHNFPSDDWRERYWASLSEYNRLLTVKKEVDPDGLFTCYHCVGYERFDNEDPSVCPDSCTCSNTPNGVCAYYVKNSSFKINGSLLLSMIFILISFIQF